MQTVIRISDDAPVIKVLQALVLSPADKGQMLDDIGAELTESARSRFIEQVSPTGQPWLQSYRAINEGGQTLRDTGRLMNSLEHEVIGDSVFYGTNVEYAEPLHFGAVITAKNGGYLTFKTGLGFAKKKQVLLPPREFLGLSQSDEQSVLGIIQQFIERQI